MMIVMKDLGSPFEEFPINISMYNVFVIDYNIIMHNVCQINELFYNFQTIKLFTIYITFYTTHLYKHV